ncbi:hypothetical protein HK099_002277 [Clydaea vesicula]|uniref:Uncharacterized protein n=1 Tax=Clydaea vesicula TaxID=447962 RepID=A0AAD5U301_9FUNG|nr:hypothetical protein HK099_002277 [Clydaea vesicula]
MSRRDFSKSPSISLFAQPCASTLSLPSVKNNKQQKICNKGKFPLTSSNDTSNTTTNVNIDVIDLTSEDNDIRKGKKRKFSESPNFIDLTTDNVLNIPNKKLNRNNIHNSCNDVEFVSMNINSRINISPPTIVSSRRRNPPPILRSSSDMMQNLARLFQYRREVERNRHEEYDGEAEETFYDRVLLGQNRIKEPNNKPSSIIIATPEPIIEENGGSKMKCAVCLCPPDEKTMLCATRCGHVFW